MTTLAEMRHRRLSDELDGSSPVHLPDTQPQAGGAVLSTAGPSSPAREMFQPWHVGNQRFLITPGWLAFKEAEYAGVPLSLMQPQAWQPGTTLVLEARVRWEWQTVPHFMGGADFYYKTGRFSVVNLEVLAIAPGDDLPVNHGPPDETSLPEHLEEDNHRYFTLGHIGLLSVTPTALGPLITCAAFTAFDVAPIG